jgi:hypothetical protein
LDQIPVQAIGGQESYQSNHWLKQQNKLFLTPQNLEAIYPEGYWTFPGKLEL